MTRLWKSELKDAINNYGPIVVLDRFRIEGQKCDIKGQSISKKRYDVLDSSKKRTKFTILSTEGTQDSEFSSFYWKNEGCNNLLLRFTDL